MGLRPQERERGLTALNEARQSRRRAIVFGRVKIREVATGFWLMTFGGLLLFSFAYYRYTLVELEARRSEVARKQRAVAAALGTGGVELRDQLEGWVIALAEGKLPEQVAPGVVLDDIANGPSIYVRLALADALERQSIRKAAGKSLRDGFTSCLFVGRAGNPQTGPACTVTSQCGPGEVCNDWNVCGAPTHPFNLRLLYEGLRVLEPEWQTALEATTDDFQVRAIELDLEDVAKHEAVAAVELIRRSKYFAAVLDEAAPVAPPDPSPPQAQAAPSAPEAQVAPAPGESPSERLQAADHPVRVGIWDIERKLPLAILRLEAAGRFVSLGSRSAADAATLRVQQRQANNCAVATDVREVLAAGRLDAASAPAEAGAEPGPPR